MFIIECCEQERIQFRICHSGCINKNHFLTKNLKYPMIRLSREMKKADFWANFGLKWALSVSIIKTHFHTKTHQKNLMIRSREMRKKSILSQL